MNMKQYFIVCCGLGFALSLSSCVKDDLYNTPHPDKGAVVVATDWSGKSAEADIPQEHILRIGNIEQAVSGTVHVFQALLLPGSHELTAYNTPEGISVSGNTASVGDAGNGQIDPQPGYLFAAHRPLTVVADDTLHVTAAMRQYVRRLDIELKVSEGDYARVSSAVATLSGVSSAIDITTGERAATGVVAFMPFVQEADRFTLFFRLLGIASGTRQSLTVDITFSNGDTQRVESDLSEVLKDFNASTAPLKLTGDLRLPVEGGFTGSIEGWKETDGGNTEAR